MIGRNDPCWCGAIDPKTGKVYKYKKCGLINAPQHRKSTRNRRERAADRTVGVLVADEQHPEHADDEQGTHAPVEIDARAIPQRERHARIFDAFDRLPVGGSLVLVNDHDAQCFRAAKA